MLSEICSSDFPVGDQWSRSYHERNQKHMYSTCLYDSLQVTPTWGLKDRFLQIINTDWFYGQVGTRPWRATSAVTSLWGSQLPRMSSFTTDDKTRQRRGLQLNHRRALGPEVRGHSISQAPRFSFCVAGSCFCCRVEVRGNEKCHARGCRKGTGGGRKYGRISNINRRFCSKVSALQAYVTGASQYNMSTRFQMLICVLSKCKTASIVFPLLMKWWMFFLLQFLIRGR